MTSVNYRLTEFFIIFIIVPILFSLHFNTWVKFTMGLLGFIYIVFVFFKVEQQKIKLASNLKWLSFLKETFLKLLLIAFITYVFVYFTNKDALFNVMITKPKLWVVILFVYSLFSVYPQELIFRTFFFRRYEGLISNKSVFIFINALVFSLGHIFFRNILVLVLTFLGGLLFAYTYYNTKSTLLVSIEHAIYGCWLFTVGMGDMLGFPS